MSLEDQGSPYGRSANRSVEERRLNAISEPQKEIVRLASSHEWRTRRQLKCAESSANALIRLGFLVSKLDGVDMLYKLRKDFNE